MIWYEEYCAKKKSFEALQRFRFLSFKHYYHGGVWSVQELFRGIANDPEHAARAVKKYLQWHGEGEEGVLLQMVQSPKSLDLNIMESSWDLHEETEAAEMLKCTEKEAEELW